LLAFALVCLAFLVGNWPKLPQGIVDRANVLSAILAILGVVLASPGIVALYSLRRSGPVTPAAVRRLADELGAATLVRWEREARSRWGEAPEGVSLRWKRADADVAADLKVTLPGDGTVDELREKVYGCLGPAGRLVILGEAGTGKTMSMIQLTIDILKQRARGSTEPIPVLLTLSGWDPARMSLRTWLVSEMSRTPADPDARGWVLGRRGVARQRREACALLDAGRVALFLDGLDEMPTGRAGACLQAIRDQAGGLRIVLTSRRQEFADAIDLRQLWHAAVIELRPVDVKAAGEFLLAQQLGGRREAWLEVADHLAAHPGGVAARALTTPLALSLAREAYRDADARALIDPNTYTTPEDLTRRLLVQALVAAYPIRRERVTALRWLEWIAERLGDSRDLRWSNIPVWLATTRPSVAKRATVLAAGIGVLCGVLTTGSAVRDAYRLAAINETLGALVTIFFMVGIYAAAGAISLGAVLDVGCEPRRFIPWLGVEGLRSLGKLAGVFTLILLGFAVVSGRLLPQWWGTLTGGVVLCLPFLPVFGIAPLSPFVGPQESYRADRRRVLAVAGYGALLLAAVAISLIHQYGGGASASSYVLGVLIGGISGAYLYATIFGLGSVTALWYLQLVLLAQGTPVSFIRLLRTAHDRRVLRQAGTAYQFRHATLQDLFASHPELLREALAAE
jgi:hypothetical protein